MMTFTHAFAQIKRVFLCWLVLGLLFTAPAMAQTVTRSALPLDASVFRHYPSFVQEEEHWSVNAVEADALLDRFWTAGSKKQMEMCVFHIALEGNAQTGVWSPVLRFYYIDGGEAINASSVSLLADGVRFDLASSSAQVSRDGAVAEVITAPMTAEAVAALQALMTAESVSFRLMGDGLYTTVLDPAAKAERGQIEAASLDGLTAGFALMEEAGVSAYGLWDLSAAAWESAHGYCPAFAMGEVTPQVGDTPVTDPFGMVKPGDRGQAVQAAQTILLESGFLSETSAVVFSQNASNAVRRAQHYLGLIETGCMDAQLERALAAGRQSETASLPEMQALGSTASVALERYWFARSVSASKDEASRHTVQNSDHVFLAADGFIRSLSASQLHLFMQVQASVVYNGAYAFTADLACEGSGGARLDTLLLPLDQARLIVYAEVPAYLAEDPSAQWAIHLTADGQTLIFDLQ